MSEGERYWIKTRIDGGRWKSVDREEYVTLERRAGFYPKGGGDGPATASFGGERVQGRVTYESITPNNDGWDEALLAEAEVATHR